MHRTITLGSCVAVQGKFERELDDGRIAVRVGKEIFVGRPVTQPELLKEKTQANA